LVVNAVEHSGMPLFQATCRAGFGRAPAWRAIPKITVSTSSGDNPACANAYFVANVAKSVAGTLLKLPPKRPIGVRTALTMAIGDSDILA
jgi:hypothetical protein